MSDLDIEIYDLSNDSVMKEFDQLLATMKQFTQHLDTTLLEKRNHLITDKQRHHLQVHNLTTEQNKLMNDIASLQHAESNTKAQLELATHQLQIQKSKIDDLIAKQQQLATVKASLVSEITQLNDTIDSSKIQLTQASANVIKQSKRDFPELMKFETYLGLKIESTSIDLLKFIFTNIDPHDCDREFWIELNVGLDVYKLGKSLPDLSQDIIHLLQDEFNEHKELVKFLKTARNLFKDLV
jgi:kinetochore protein Spc25